MLNRILQLNLDKQEEQIPAQLSLGLHENIRGAKNYH
jgi:hypothetical protein